MPRHWASEMRKGREFESNNFSLLASVKILVFSGQFAFVCKALGSDKPSTLLQPRFPFFCASQDPRGGSQHLSRDFYACLVQFEKAIPSTTAGDAALGFLEAHEFSTCILNAMEL